MEIITSKQNPAIIAAAKLADKKYREQTRTFAFEGVKLFCEAVSAGVSFTRIFVTEAAYQKYGDILSGAGDGKISVVSEPVYEKLSFEKAPQGIFCVAAFFEPPTGGGNDSFVIFLDGVSDPGNFGAILRAADAFGVDTVYTGENGADLYNPKTVRACMGSLFRVNVHRTTDLVSDIHCLCKNGFHVFATALDKRSVDIRQTDLSGKIGFVIGNEGHGISDAVLSACTGSVIIPMMEGPQSLNAAVAAGVVMWEAARNRMDGRLESI